MEQTFKVFESEINFDNYASENKTQQNLKWTYVPDHP